MKILIAVFSLFLSITVQAEAISAKSLIEIESRIEIQKETLQERLKQANTDDIIEGKIVASIAELVRSKLTEAQSDLASIDSEEELTSENIDNINKILDASEKLIKEI